MTYIISIRMDRNLIRSLIHRASVSHTNARRQLIIDPWQRNGEQYSTAFCFPVSIKVADVLICLACSQRHSPASSYWKPLKVWFFFSSQQFPDWLFELLIICDNINSQLLDRWLSLLNHFHSSGIHFLHGVKTCHKSSETLVRWTGLPENFMV